EQEHHDLFVDFRAGVHRPVYPRLGHVPVAQPGVDRDGDLLAAVAEFDGDFRAAEDRGEAVQRVGVPGRTLPRHESLPSYKNVLLPAQCFAHSMRRTSCRLAYLKFSPAVSSVSWPRGVAPSTTMVLPETSMWPFSSSAFSTRPAISREQPTMRPISWRLMRICMPSGCVIASGSLHRSSSTREMRPVTSRKARSPTLRVVRPRRAAIWLASSNSSSGSSL